MNRLQNNLGRRSYLADIEPSCEEGIWDASIARAYKDAYEITTEIGNGSRVRVFAEREYDARRLIEGDDSLVTVKMKRAAEELSA